MKRILFILFLAAAAFSADAQIIKGAGVIYFRDTANVNADTMGTEIAYVIDTQKLMYWDRGTQSWKELSADEEFIQDIAGAMATGGTQSNIVITYDDVLGVLNFSVTPPSSEIADSLVTIRNEIDTLPTFYEVDSIHQDRIATFSPTAGNFSILSSAYEEINVLNFASLATNAFSTVSMDLPTQVGRYMFHMKGTKTQAVDFPANFFLYNGAAADGGSVFWTPNDKIYDCYFDGVAFYCNTSQEEPVFEEFISTWDTALPGTSGATGVTLPLVSTGNYSFRVDWGDGSSDFITTYNQPEVTHTYGAAGIYVIEILGVCNGWVFNDAGDDDKITDISAWGSLKVGTIQGTYFNGCSNLNVSALDTLDVSNVTNMGSAFSSCTSLTTLDVSGWDVSNVTNMTDMFSLSPAFTSLNVSAWDVSEVTNMSFMFRSCTSLTTLDVSGWNTSKMTNFSSTFLACPNLTALDVSGWDVSNVTNISSMLRQCSSLANIDVSAWNTSKMTNMSSAFNDCDDFTALDVSGWDVSNVTTINSMFNLCSSLANIDVSAWNTSKMTNMGSAFSRCSSLNTLDVSAWDVSKVTNMSSMFSFSGSLTTLDVSAWNTSSVTNMREVFRTSGVDTIGVYNWNITSVTDMTEMFFETTLTTSNYDDILVAFDAQAVQNNVPFHGGNSTFTAASAAATARANLIADHAWTITDGGSTP